MELMFLYDLADREGILIDTFPMERHVSFSLMDSDGDCYVAIDPEQLDSSQTEKIILSHELGHCLTGSFYNQYASCDIRQRHENRANKNSVQRLVPKDELDEAVSAGFTEVWQLADYFDIPCDFMAMACHWYQHHSMNFIA